MFLRRSFNLMLAFFILSALVLTVTAPVMAQPAVSGPADPQEVTAFMDGLMSSQMAENHVPGAVVVLVKDGQVLFSKGYGFTDLALRSPVDPASTLFRPGSVSKLFVWTSVMQLVEAGKLDLDADVNRYLDFTIPATFPQPITLKSLMTHTPGFEDKGEDLFKLTPEAMLSLDAYLKKDLPARVFSPGTVGAYSNYGTALAGYIVERVSGLPFAEYVEKNIFTQLGMTHATFRQPLPAGLAADMSGGFNYVNGEYVQGGFEYVNAYPAGSLSASGLDMARFMIAHLQNGKYGDAQILKEQTALQMHTRLYSPDPRLDGMAYGFFESTVNGQRILSHGGDTLLFHTGLLLFIDQNTGLFVSTNATGGAKVVSAVERAFLDHYFPVDRAPDPVPAADYNARAAQYSGEYFMSRSNFTGFEKFLRLLSPISVSVDAKKQIIVSLAGQVTRYVETEPGLLVSLEHPDSKMVMKNENGQVTLSPSGPFVLIKSPWQTSNSIQLLILGGGALLFLFTLPGWLKSILGGLFKPTSLPRWALLSRLIASLFGLAYLVFVGGLAVAMLDNNPAYGVPNLFFEIPAWFGMLMVLPVATGVFGILMVPCALLGWVARGWTFANRLYYTLLTLTAFAILASLIYWNFLL